MISLNFTPFPVLTTDRLILRQLNTEDENEIFNIRSDKRIAEFLDRPLIKSIEEARRFISNINEDISNNLCIYWAVCFKNNPQLAGTVCLWNISKEHSKADIGYELLNEYQGKGIMNEAVKSVILFGFKVMQLDIIEAEVDPSNIKSIRLLENNNFKLKEIRDTKTVIYELYKYNRSGMIL